METPTSYAKIRDTLSLSSSDKDQGIIRNAWVDGNRIVWASEKLAGLQYVTLQADAVPQLILPLEFTTLPLSVSLSPDASILALLRNQQQVELVALQEGQGVLQTKKTVKLLGLHWLYHDSLLLVSDQTLEVYQWQGLKKGFRLLKEVRQAVNWYCYEARVVVVGVAPASLVTYVVKSGGRVERLARTALEGVTHPLVPLQCRLVQLYLRLYFVYIDAQAAHVLLYQVTTTDVQLKYRLSFLLAAPAHKIGLSLVDNLILIHNAEAQITLLFDVKDVGDAQRDKHAHYPLVAPLPLYSEHLPAVYTAAWRYQEQFMISLLEQRVYELEVDIEAVARCLEEGPRRLTFLLRRRHSKPLVVRLVRAMIEHKHPLEGLGTLFDILSQHLAADGGKSNARKETGERIDTSQIAALLRKDTAPISPRPAARTQAAEMHTEKRTADGILLLEQDDMYRCVFLTIDESPAAADSRYLIGVLVEYIRSLNFHQLVVEHYIYELLIDLLVRNHKFNQLHQFLQYHVLADSLHVACQLLSLESVYPPAYQLALDMLKRLTSPEQIVEVLLSRGQVLAAVRLLKSHPSSAVKVSPVRFMEAAEQQLLHKDDSTLFFTVYTFFNARQELVGPTYERFHAIYERLFASPAS